MSRVTEGRMEQGGRVARRTWCCACRASERFVAVEHRFQLKRVRLRASFGWAL